MLASAFAMLQLMLSETVRQNYRQWDKDASLAQRKRIQDPSVMEIYDLEENDSELRDRHDTQTLIAAT